MYETRFSAGYTELSPGHHAVHATAEANYGYNEDLELGLVADVDGVLVGAASLDPESFARISESG